MKINEVLEYETEEELGHLEPLANMLEAESGDMVFSSYYFYEDKFPDIKIKIVKKFDFDHRHTWFMGVVYFRDQRVMLIQTCGKDSWEPRGSWILNGSVYNDMIHYWRTVVYENSDDFFHNLEEDWEVDIPTLGDFYGQKLTDEFEKYEDRV